MIMIMIIVIIIIIVKRIRIRIRIRIRVRVLIMMMIAVSPKSKSFSASLRRPQLEAAVAASGYPGVTMRMQVSWGARYGTYDASARQRNGHSCTARNATPRLLRAAAQHVRGWAITST